MDYSVLIDKKLRRFQELEEEISGGLIFDNAGRARDTLREHARLKELVELWNAYQKIERELEESQRLAVSEDAEMAELASAEIPPLGKRLGELEKDLQIALLPPEPGEDRDAIVEIRAGTGGTEAALFAADLYRMCSRFAEANQWKVEAMDSSEADLGGLKEIVFRLSGVRSFERCATSPVSTVSSEFPPLKHKGAFILLRRRLPCCPRPKRSISNSKWRTCGSRFAALEVPEDSVNTTDSAVQILHIPTGRIVRCQDGRSQQQEGTRTPDHAVSAPRRQTAPGGGEVFSTPRSLIGGGGREEKIRTYNFPQNRVTDHRIGLTLYSLDRFMEGDIEEMIDSLQASDISQRLKEADIG